MIAKLPRAFILVLVAILMTSVFCQAQSEKAPPNIFKLTGTIIMLQDNTLIRVLYEKKDNLHFTSDFKINDKTRIKGNLEVGAVVTVTFIKQRVLRNILRRVALAIEVIQESVPEESGSAVRGY